MTILVVSFVHYDVACMYPGDLALDLDNRLLIPFFPSLPFDIFCTEL